MNLANQPARTYSKNDQLHSKRVKLTQKQMGDISAQVDKELKVRSGGICERCRAARATERAHIIRRGKLTHKTTVKDLAHLCTVCHKFADSGYEGRKWLKEFQSNL